MAPPALLSGSQPVTPRTRLDLSPAGVSLVLRVPAGEVLGSASIRLAAVSDVPAPVLPKRLSSDQGDFAAGKMARFVEAAFDGEVAVSSLTLAGAPGMARVRVFGNGVWTPLTPLDTVLVGVEQVFPAVAALRVNAEFLVASPPQAPVAVPAPLAINSVTVKATPQPCQVSVAVGDDPPFFSVPGPLPATPVSVDGLARIAARWLLDHRPDTDVPLRLAAAGRGTVQLVDFRATSAAEPVPPRPADGGGPAPPPVIPDPPAAVETLRALLCDDGHAVAQRFGPGGALIALALWMRPGAGAVAGEVVLVADDQGRPGTTALAEAMAFAIDAAAEREPQWLVLVPPGPVRLTGPWWAVCRVTQGEMLWYRAPPAAGVAEPVVSVDGGAWQADADDPPLAALQAAPIWAAS